MFLKKTKLSFLCVMKFLFGWNLGTACSQSSHGCIVLHVAIIDIFLVLNAFNSSYLISCMGATVDSGDVNQLGNRLNGIECPWQRNTKVRKAKQVVGAPLLSDMVFGLLIAMNTI